MSIALENNQIGQVSRNGFLRRSKMGACNRSILDHGDRTLVRGVVADESESGPLDHPCSSSSSSIGKNSDDEVGKDEEEEEEVQSKLKRTIPTSPFDSAVDALEKALPIRRGISQFYNGKSKSFASLSDAACSSIKEIAKPENAYSRKRKNLLAHSLLYDKGRTLGLKSPGIGGGISKRPIPSSRSSLALTFAIDENGSSDETNWSDYSQTPSQSPPTSPHPLTPWRSFSMADLQHCAVSASAVSSNLPSPLMVKRTKPDEVS